MKLTLISILVLLAILILIKHNSNNLNFMNGQVVVEEDITENFNNIPQNFICDKNEVACIFSYQKYNQDCRNSFGLWKQFQTLNHNKNINGRKLKIMAIDSNLNPNLSIQGKFDGPRVCLVSRYNIKNYDGRLNLENLEKFINQSI